MASLAHRSKQRRAERAPLTAHGSINLVPLVDILTSIVFFSLLTYSAETMAALTAYDLTLPPTVVTAEQAAASATQPEINLLLAVRIENNQIKVEHSGGQQGGVAGFSQTISGISGASLDTLESLMKDIRRQYPQNSDVLVVPADDVSYDDVIHVLERLKIATYTGISLGNRTRSTQIASAGEVSR
ncbi:MAG TPA: biopolymer transporter ExbD [Gemmatimonadaceae bacterium]|nr:biopolymer transporter ExbD [Gemmatimonadaceae bacterium]